MKYTVYLILPAALGPGIYTASNRNKYQKKEKKKSFWEIEHGRLLRLSTSLPTVS
jgi:hypothetical protein